MGVSNHNPDRDALRQKIAELERMTGIPHHYAVQVATNQLSLNDVLQRLALQDQVEGLMRRHALNRALATQVARGHANLAHILRKKRMIAHKEENYERSCLEESVGGDPVGLSLHGRRDVRGQIVNVDQYEFDFQPQSGEPERIHKLQAKFIYAARDAKRVRRALRFERELRDTPLEPIDRPQDRYTCSDRRLFGYCDQETSVRALTLEGDVLKGQVIWMGRYEFGLRLKGGVEVVLFRHALSDLSEA